MKRRETGRSGPREEDSPKPSKLPKKSTVPVGEELHDTEERVWSLDTVLAEGHWGPIYSASSVSSNSSEEYVIKIEPIESGHLRREVSFYQRAAKKRMIETWMKQHDLHHLGILYLTGSGIHTHNENRYRFVVLQRQGHDLQRLLESKEALLSVQTVYWLGIKMLECLEFIHDHDYVHGDVTAANILLGYNDGKVEDTEVYLVDYGLSYLYRTDGKQKHYQENLKLSPEGSKEFMSRDAHKCVALSPRGDLEMLGYSLLKWLCGHLPWEDKLMDNKYVIDSKIKFMEDIPSHVKQCTLQLDSKDKSQTRGTMISYFNYVSNLGYKEQPDYNHLKQLLFLVRSGIQDDWKLELLLKREKAYGTGQSLRREKSRSLFPQTSTSEEVPRETKSGEYSSRRKSTAIKKVELHGHTSPQSESSIQNITDSTCSVTLKQWACYNPSQKVILNIGGKTFVTLMSTLQKYPSRLSEEALKQILQEEIFFNRDHTYFTYILNYLRDEETTLPDSNLDLRKLLDESLFYDLPTLSRRIEDLIE